VGKGCKNKLETNLDFYKEIVKTSENTFVSPQAFAEVVEGAKLFSIVKLT